MAILATGGAGFIGSVVTEELISDGHEVVVVDNLQKGHRKAVSPRASFFQADIRNRLALNKLFNEFHIEAVMHMAAETEVETSMKDPQLHYGDNVAGGLSLLDSMQENNVRSIIFSSSAAVYGEPQKALVEEDHPLDPVNVYGETKLFFERILRAYQRAYGLNFVSLRYFNAAGASREHGEDHDPETHLIPRIIRAAKGLDAAIKVFGNDYPTRDGSCLRDYVHVADIARAHILAWQKINHVNGQASNLGSGDGYSVLEVIEAVRKVSGKNLEVRIGPRRSGDPAVLVASSEKAHRELGWLPKYSDLDSIVASAWRWASEHPDGYTV